MPRKKLIPPRDIKVTRKLSRPVYDAAQRWMNANSKTLTEAIEQGLLALPGFRELYQEEMEAYDREVKRNKQGEANTLKDRIRADQAINEA